MKALPFLNILVGAAVFCATTVRATCYNPDGSSISNPAFQPCNQVVGAVSMCCGTNWTGGKVTPDVCYPNGLCLNNDMGTPLFWRGSCTDPTWKSPNCLSNLCTTYAENGDPTQNVALTDCGDGSWCCQGGNSTCCTEGLGVKIAATIGVSSTSTAASSSQSTSSSSAPSTTSAPASVTNSPGGGTSTNTAISLGPPSEGLSTGAKIGIAIGVILGAVLIAAPIGFWIYRKKRRYDPVETASNPWELKAQELPVSEPPRELADKNGPGSFQHEMQGDSPPIAELAATRYSRGQLPQTDRYGPR